MVKNLVYVSSDGIVQSYSKHVIAMGNLSVNYDNHMGLIASSKASNLGYLYEASFNNEDSYLTVWEAVPNENNSLKVEFKAKFIQTILQPALEHWSEFIIHQLNGQEEIFMANVSSFNWKSINVYSIDTSNYSFKIHPSLYAADDVTFLSSPQLVSWRKTLYLFILETSGSDEAIACYSYNNQNNTWNRVNSFDDITLYNIDHNFKVVSYQGYIYIFFDREQKYRFLRTDTVVADESPPYFSNELYNNFAVTLHGGILRILRFNANVTPLQIADYKFDGLQVSLQSERTITNVSDPFLSKLSICGIGNRLIIPMIVEEQ